MGLLSLDPTVRREAASNRRWGPKAPHKDSCQSVRHGEVEQDGVLSLGTKCSCDLQTGNNFCTLVMHCILNLNLKIILLHLLNETHLEKDVRARMYLEILGNTLISEATGAWVRKTSGKFAGIISSGRSDILESSWDLSLLKDKEKEKMVEVFKMWREGAARKDITECWTARQQKLLGNI